MSEDPDEEETDDELERDAQANDDAYENWLNREMGV